MHDPNHDDFRSTPLDANFMFWLDVRVANNISQMAGKTFWQAGRRSSLGKLGHDGLGIFICHDPAGMDDGTLAGIFFADDRVRDIHRRVVVSRRKREMGRTRARIYYQRDPAVAFGGVRIKQEGKAMDSKSIFVSKTFYVNLLALVAMIVQGATGKEFISLEVQASILAGINIILRFVTKKPVTW